jgi:hypothetical protein
MIPVLLQHWPPAPRPRLLLRCFEKEGLLHSRAPSPAPFLRPFLNTLSRRPPALAQCGRAFSRFDSVTLRTDLAARGRRFRQG